jgi:hypothetical protein
VLQNDDVSQLPKFIFMPLKWRKCDEKLHLSTVSFHFDMNVVPRFSITTKSKSEIQIKMWTNELSTKFSYFRLLKARNHLGEYPW